MVNILRQIDRKNLAICVISALILCGCFGLTFHWTGSSVTQSTEASVPLFSLAPNHTITIDGDISDWMADEVMGSDAGKILRITWNSSHFFIAWEGTAWETEGDLFIYLDVRSGGSSTSDSWSGTHTLPFQADWLFAVEDAGYTNLRQFNSSWQADQPYTGQVYIGYAGNNITEISIPFDNLDGIVNGDCDFTSMNVTIFAQAESNNDVWASFPEANPAGSSGSETFTNYYNFIISGSDGGPGIPGFEGILILLALVAAVFSLKKETFQ